MARDNDGDIYLDISEIGHSLSPAQTQELLTEIRESVLEFCDEEIRGGVIGILLRQASSKGRTCYYLAE